MHHGGRERRGDDRACCPASRYLKDNRLLPHGFDKRTAEPDIAVHGAALDDPDFTGAGDRVRYPCR